MPNVIYTVPERVEMVRHHEQGLSYGRIRDHFAATYPDRPIPSKSTIGKIVKKFCQTGNIDPSLTKLSYPSTQLPEETKLNICLAVEEGLKKPLSKIAQELQISKASVQRIVRSHKYKTKFKPYDLRNSNNKKITPPIVNEEDDTMTDSSPLHFSLWSYLKHKLHSEGRIEELTTLWDRVTEVLVELDPEMISRINCALDITPPDTKEFLTIFCDQNSSESS